MFMRIPMRGAIGSLNAAVAGSILLFEAVAQRDPGSRAEARTTAAGAPTTTATAPAPEASEDVAVKVPKARKTQPKTTEGAVKSPKTSKARTAAAAHDAPAEELDTDLLPGGPAPSDPPEPDEPPTP
jgi:hypothetical protein